jgi:hypothetical protein
MDNDMDETDKLDKYMRRVCDRDVKAESNGTFVNFNLSAFAFNNGNSLLSFDFEGEVNPRVYDMQMMKEEKLENVVENLNYLFESKVLFSKSYLDEAIFSVRIMDENNAGFENKDDLNNFMDSDQDFLKPDFRRKEYGQWTSDGNGRERMFDRLRYRGIHVTIRELVSEGSYAIDFQQLRSMNYQPLMSNSNTRDMFHVFANLGNCCPEYTKELKHIIGSSIDTVNCYESNKMDYFGGKFRFVVKDKITVFKNGINRSNNLENGENNNFQDTIKVLKCFDYKKFESFEKLNKHFEMEGGVLYFKEFKDYDSPATLLYKFEDKNGNFYLEMVKHQNNSDHNKQYVWKFKEDFNWESAKVFLKQFEKEIGFENSPNVFKKKSKLYGGR